MKGPGARPGRVRFARVYQILICAPRWEPPLSTRGYTVSGSGPKVASEKSKSAPAQSPPSQSGPPFVARSSGSRTTSLSPSHWSSVASPEAQPCQARGWEAPAHWGSAGGDRSKWPGGGHVYLRKVRRYPHLSGQAVHSNPRSERAGPAGPSADRRRREGSER